MGNIPHGRKKKNKPKSQTQSKKYKENKNQTQSNHYTQNTQIKQGLPIQHSTIQIKQADPAKWMPQIKKTKQPNPKFGGEKKRWPLAKEGFDVL